jgi:hypothetical protein
MDAAALHALRAHASRRVCGGGLSFREWQNASRFGASTMDTMMDAIR